MTKIGKPISNAQVSYIMQLIKDRVNRQAVLVSDIPPGFSIPHITGDGEIKTILRAATMGQASEMIGYLHTQAMQPGGAEPRDRNDSATDAQRRNIWRLLKELNYSTFEVFTLKHDDADIPHLDTGEARSKVWDWASELTVAQAIEVIDYLQTVRSGDTRSPSIAPHDDSDEIPF